MIDGKPNNLWIRINDYDARTNACEADVFDEKQENDESGSFTHYREVTDNSVEFDAGVDAACAFISRVDPQGEAYAEMVRNYMYGDEKKGVSNEA